MLSFEYYLEALRNNAFIRNHWAFNVFTETLEEEDEYLKDPYPYRIVRKDDKVYFINATGELVQITNLKGKAIVMPVDTPLDLLPGDLANIKTPVETSAGEAYINATCLCYPFGAKLDYMSGSFTAGDIEELVVKRLKSNVSLEEETEDDIYVHELKKFSKVILGITALNSVLVTSASPKNVTFDPKMIELRNKGIEELKSRGLENDPIELAKLEKSIEAVDRAWCDDYGSKYFTEAKEFNNSRKKLFTHVGYEKDFLNPDTGKYNNKSLTEGMNVEMFAETVNTAREGSYSRGYLTALGGADVKSAIRSMQNARIVEGFCGTKLGQEWTVVEEDRNTLVNFYHIREGKQPELITTENFASLVGRKLFIASPGFCSLPHTDYCSVCIGKVSADSPNSLPANVSDISSSNMYKFMKKMHVSTIVLTELDMDKSLLS